MNTTSLAFHQVRLRFLLLWKLHWRQLVVSALLYRLLAFVVLTPLISGLIHLVLRLSGKSVLTDLDIAKFFLHPLGAAGGIAIAAVWLAIVALEQGALLGVLSCRKPGRGTVIAGWSLAISKIAPLLQVTLRLTIATLLAAAPFLLLAGLTYSGLLRDHDINYYLREKPPKFLLAVGIGVLLGGTLIGLCLRLWSGWLLALPLTLLESVPGSDSMRESRTRTNGQRPRIVAWLLLWGVSLCVVSSALTLIGGLLGRWLLPTDSDSLFQLVLAAGLLVIGWSVGQLALNVLASTTFATLLMTIHRDLGGAAPSPSPAAGAGVTALWGLSRRKAIAIAVVGLLLAAGIGWLTLRRIPANDQVAVMAHRGASKDAPENTLAAIDAAIEAGADWVEIDVQETADGEVVVFHDSDFMKMAGNPLKLWEATADDLRQLDIGSLFDPSFADQRVPTLAEVLQRCRDKIGVNIELKYYGHDQDLERKVAELVEAAGMTEQVLIMSLKPEAVAKMKSLRPDWKVGLLMSVSAGGKPPADVDFLAVNAGFVNTALIRRSHRDGQQVFAWTVNDALTMSHLAGRGVDALLTDRPALARQVLQERAELSVAERLLLELAVAVGAPSPLGEF